MFCSFIVGEANSRVTRDFDCWHTDRLGEGSGIY